MTSNVEFYFDLASPYSRIACHLMNEKKNLYGEKFIEITCIPVSLISIIKASSGTISTKKQSIIYWIWKDLRRYTE